MRKTTIIVLSGVLLIGLALASVGYAQTIPALLNETQNKIDENYSDADTVIGVVCSGDKRHPVLEELEEEFGVAYAELLFYFCDYEFGIGEITHALFTAALEDVEFTYEELLEWRYDGGTKDVGWGQIWQALGLIGLDLDDLDLDDQEGDDGPKPVCSGEMIHPALNKLAENFEVDYTDLLVYFCEYQFGVGEIMLALESARQDGVELTYDEVLELRLDGDKKSVGWGRIKQALGLIGRDRFNNPAEIIEGEETEQNQEQNANGNKKDKPATPPGHSGGHPGKGRGPNK